MERENTRLEVLVSTMHQTNYGIVEKMNIQSDSIIVNQCDSFDYNEFDYKGNRIRFLSFEERGVGLSRNNALMRSKADICMLADDDMVYKDNYKELVIKAFEDNLKADMIMFNVPIHKKMGGK